MFTKIFIPFLIVSSSVVMGLGINCRGNPSCSIAGTYGVHLTDFQEWFRSIDPNRWYDNGEHIACRTVTVVQGLPGVNGDATVCAFLQGTGGDWGSVMQPLIDDLVDHGCKTCGSVPLFFPQGNNNVGDGQLTFNIVSKEDAACDGWLC